MKLEDYLVSTKPDYRNPFPPGKLILFVGDEKTGKTTAASTFSPKGADGVVILDLEAGARCDKNITMLIHGLYPMEDEKGNIIPPEKRGFRDSSGNIQPAYSIYEALAILKQTWKDSGKTTLVIDTFDKLAEWVNEDTLAQMKAEDAELDNPKWQTVQTIEEIPYAQGIARARNTSLRIKDRLLDIIKDTGLLICNLHTQKTMRVENGRDIIVKKLPMIHEKLATILGHQAELIGMFTVDASGNYLFDVRGFGEVTLGTRIEPLNGKIFKWNKTHPTLYEVLTKECLKYAEKLEGKEK